MTLLRTSNFSWRRPLSALLFILLLAGTYATAEPYLVRNAKIFVPFRWVCEQAGLPLHYDPATGKATITLARRVVSALLPATPETGMKSSEPSFRYGAVLYVNAYFATADLVLSLQHGAHDLIILATATDRRAILYPDTNTENAHGIPADNSPNALALRQACVAGETKTAAKLLDQHPELINAADDEGRAPVHLAALNGQTATIRLLASLGANVNAPSGNADNAVLGVNKERLPGGYETPVFFAAEAGATEAITALLDLHADPNLPSNHNTCSLDDAIWCAHPAAAKQLLEHGALATAHDDTALLLAARVGDIDTARLLLAAGANANAHDAAGRTPLHAAAASAPLLELLLAHHVDIDARDADGRTPLHLAAQVEDAAPATLLLRHGANVDARDRDGHRPLHLVRSPLTALALIDGGADVNAHDQVGDTALIRVTRPPNSLLTAAIACVLTTHGADPNARDARGETPLLLVCSPEKEIASITPALVEPLFTAGADPNARDFEGSTALHRMLRNPNATPNPQVLKLFLTHHADLQAFDKLGLTPRDMAKKHTAEYVRVMIEEASGK